MTIRLDDDIRDALTLRAEEGGMTMSDFVRELIRAAVVPVRVEDGAREGFAPDTLSPSERHTLSLLHRILARVLPEDANGADGDPAYQLQRATVLEKGFTQEYWTEYAGINSELKKRDAKFCMDVLDMFRMIDFSITEHAKNEPISEELAHSLRYRGFDHNDALEQKMASYVEFLISDGRWVERADFVEGPERGNSHHPTLETYSRMLAEYRRIREDQRKKPSSGRTSRGLSIEGLQALAAARVHPDNR